MENTVFSISVYSKSFFKFLLFGSGIGNTGILCVTLNLIHIDLFCFCIHVDQFLVIFDFSVLFCWPNIITFTFTIQINPCREEVNLSFVTWSMLGGLECAALLEYVAAFGNWNVLLFWNVLFFSSQYKWLLFWKTCLVVLLMKTLHNFYWFHMNLMEVITSLMHGLIPSPWDYPSR